MVCGILSAQSDTFPLPISRLDESDIIFQKEAEKRTFVRCASRTDQEIGDVMNRVFVVTGAEILKNGWVTLTDVLRNVPGIRVSQPGNALEGETFLMDGTHGNSEVEILINDIPLRPTAAKGMPIGSQLPIRQAERIEVLYGPGGGFYGRDAPGGIVNIILKETERPLFTQADLSFGKNGYTSLDLFFGGKLGRDKNIFRFAIFGSSTAADDRDLFQTAPKNQLLNAANYLLPGQDSNFYLLPFNFMGTEISSNNGPPTETSRSQLAKMPLESRLFGINMRWRGLQFAYNRMYRRDHSAIGLSPLAMSYANSQNFIGEKIETFSVHAQRTRDRGGFFYTGSMVLYKMDDRSTEAWVAPMLETAYFRHIDPNNQLTLAERKQAIFSFNSSYTDDTRFLIATSADLRHEIRWDRRLGKSFRLELGHALELNALHPLVRYSRIPSQGIGYLNEGSVFFSQIQYNSLEFDGKLSGWAQLHFQHKKWQILANSMYLYDIDSRVNSRVCGGFRAFPWWQVRGCLAEIYRQLPYWTNTETIQFSTIAQNQTILFGSGNYFSRLPKERTNSGEIGSHFTKKGLFTADLDFFWRKKTHFAAPGYYLKQATSPNEIEHGAYGWFSTADSKQMVRGLQAVLQLEPQNIDLDILKRNIRFNWENRLFYTFTNGQTRMPDLTGPMEGIAGLSKHILRVQTGFLFQKTTVLLHFNSESNAPTSEYFWKNRWARTNPHNLDKGNMSVDFVFRRSMSKNFQVYFLMNNVFNHENSGLDATGTPDDLFFNPQPGRQTRLGINYNMN